VGAPAHFLHPSHLVVDLGVVAREERRAVDDHVDLVSAELRDARGFLDLDVERRLAGGKRGRH
jgi:hypothetical protein